MQILNMGLFTQDIPVESHLQYNHINSVTEFIAEVSLGIDNAFPEHNNHQKQDKNSKHSTFHLKSFSVHLAKPNSPFLSIVSLQTNTNLIHQIRREKSYESFVLETNSPPPKHTV